MAVKSPASGHYLALCLQGKGWQHKWKRFGRCGHVEWLAVERTIFHYAEVSRVGALAPFYFQIGVVACPSAVLHRYRAAHFCKILCALCLAVKVTVVERHAAVGFCGIERFPAIECQSAMVVNSCAAQGVVRTLEVTVVKSRVFCAYERTEVKT